MIKCESTEIDFICFNNEENQVNGLEMEVCVHGNVQDAIV